jgi:hypothetical protein
LLASLQPVSLVLGGVALTVGLVVRFAVLG